MTSTSKFTAAVACHRCLSKPSITNQSGYGHVVSCPECYDGAPDSALRNEIGSGRFVSDAIRDWNKMQYRLGVDAWTS